ncbi:hypothetical protein [Nostoc sp. NMS8]|uniref:hypothetical protein n=1 Tax=Nostoc sp. NMS8 TaxID=2815392 RepID=UPI0025FE4DA1|nr:hypothetical protein [Nostoc sp. NMS8]MBN3961651.1 hypothetical protein [Nostoc sp. NMS8]
MTTTLETKHLPTNRPITLNKTLAIDGINTPGSSIKVDSKKIQFYNSVSRTDAILSCDRTTMTVFKSSIDDLFK